MIMRRLMLLIAVLVASACMVEASAQQVVKKRTGVFIEDGNVVVAEATTTLTIKLVIEHEEFTAGPYARYAQKFFGTRAMLVDKSSYSIVDADVAVKGEFDHGFEVMDETTSLDESTLPLQIDRLSSAEMTAENAARDAAETVFRLRNARLDLITGEQGDGTFGAGLQSALEQIDRLEKAYLELFYGVQRVTRIVEYVDMPVSASQTTAVVARFSTERGMVAINDLSGDIVLVDIKPSDMTYPASDEKGKVAYRYANNAEVCVGLSNVVLVSRILPIYEFGETVMYNKPAR